MTQPRLIRLDQWLQIMFGDNPPTRRTIWRWIEAGRIYPAPQKSAPLPTSAMSLGFWQTMYAAYWVMQTLAKP